MKTKNILSFFSLLVGLAMLLMLVSPSPVFAEGEEPAATPEAPQIAVTETPAAEPTSVIAPAEAPVLDPAPVIEPTETAPAETIPPAETSAPEAAAVTAPTDRAAEQTEEITEVVAVLAETGAVLVDENNAIIPLASQDAVEIIQASDPFFWNGTSWVGYTTNGTGCPANVTCLASATPFQAAVSAAPGGSMIYVAHGYYDEDVVINVPNLSFTAFTFIDVPVSYALLTPTASGYAVVKSITLLQDFGETKGVYADKVIVNNLDLNSNPNATGSTGNGRLDDALKLVNKNGVIEADVQMTSYPYLLRDFNHLGEPVWDNASSTWCVDADYGGRAPRFAWGTWFRIDLLEPDNPQLLTYLETTWGGVDLANPGTPRTIEKRIADLEEGLKRHSQQSAPDFWRWQTIFYALLGMVPNDSSSGLNDTEIALVNNIINRNSDTQIDGFKTTFIWPLHRVGSDGKVLFYDPWHEAPEYDYLGGQIRVQYSIDEDPILGCTDPAMYNYDPNASLNNGTCVAFCRYNPSLPQGHPDCHAPQTAGVGGGGGGGQVKDPLAIIPVTGVDQAELAGNVLRNLGMLIVGLGLIRAGMRKDK